MEDLFSHLRLYDLHADLFRNIVSLRQSVNLFDDLSDSPTAQAIAVQLEIRFKPLTYESSQPIIHRPFEEALYNDAIGYPFTHWSESRYSDGSFGVWYGAREFNTSIHETVHHWRSGFLADAGLEHHEGIAIERRVHLVRADAALLDLRASADDFPALIDPDSYQFTHSVGRRIHHEGHPGLLTRSARCSGEVCAMFTPKVLTNPRVHAYLTYRIEQGKVRVYRQEDEVLLTI